jgi:hypothetical protein
VIDRLAPEFLARWNSWYPNSPPVGFLLRDAAPHRWLRIYSLPEGKRYPTSGFEYAELRRRHHVVANDVLGSGAPCALLLLGACSNTTGADLANMLGLGQEAVPFVTELDSSISQEPDGIFATAMCLFGGEIVWHAPYFDGFIAATAEDRVDGLVVELHTGGVYAPYDGGADLFYPTEVQRNQAWQQFADWRSPRKDGL